MEKKIELKDVLHLYHHCQAEIEFKDGAKGVTRLEFAHIEGYHNTGLVPMLKNLKPLLRPLSSMTEEEMRETRELMQLTTDGVHQVGLYVHTPKSFAYQLSKHFDLFNLIETNQAIDATKQTV